MGNMPKILHFRQNAESDVAEIVSYIADDNPEAAQRFRKALQKTGELLLDMPNIGSIRVSDRPALKDIRVVPVRDFDKYFVFYRPMNNGIEIIRLLHGARDYPSFFAE